jgi:hypothetical protein
MEHSLGLFQETLDKNSIDNTIKDKNIKYILEINLTSLTEQSILVYHQEYDIILYDVLNSKNIWRAQVEITRSGLGIIGLNNGSAITLSKRIISKLIEDGFI